LGLSQGPVNYPIDVETLCAAQKIHHNEQYSSHLKLPIIKEGLQQKGL